MLSKNIIVPAVGLVLLIAVAMAYSEYTAMHSSDSVAVTQNVPTVKMVSNDGSYDELIAKLDQLNAGIEKTQKTVNDLSQRVQIIETLGAESTNSGASTEIKDIAQFLPQARTAEQSQEDLQDFMQSLEVDFTAQDLDEAWGADSEAKISETFQNQDNLAYKAIRLANVECRSSSCKVDVSYEQEADTEEFESEFVIDAMKKGFPRVRGRIDPETGTASYYLSQSNDSDAHSHLTSSIGTVQ